MSRSIEIEAVTGYTDELGSFFREAWPDDPSAGHEDTIKWRYRMSAAETLRGVHIVARANSRIVGHLGVLPNSVATGGRHINAAWLMDWVVLPSHRGGRAGMNLMNHAVELYPLVMAVGLTKASESIFRRSGWLDGGMTTRYCRAGRPERLTAVHYPSLKRIPGLESLIRTANRIVRTKPAPVIAASDLHVAEAEIYPENIEEIARSEIGTKPHVLRSTEYLAARYRDVPPWPYYHYHLLRGKETIGWGAWSEKPRADGIVQASVLELLVRGGDDVGKAVLLRYMTDEMERRNADLYELAGMNLIPDHVARAAGYRPREGLLFMYRCNSREEPFPDLSSWYLSRGDSDQDR